MKTFALLVTLVTLALAQAARAQAVRPATSEPPNPDLMFRAKVIEKSGTAHQFTLRLQKADGSTFQSEHTQYSFGASPAGSGLFDLLEVGREYDFPKSMSDDPVHLGLGGRPKNGGRGDPMTFMMVFDHCPVPVDSRLFHQASSGMSIAGLKYCAPFRAKVVSKSVTADSVSLTLLRTDGERSGIIQNGSFGLSAAVAVVDRLDEGGFYEFPHVFSTARGDLPREVRPATPEMKALSKWIGQWQNIRDGAADGTEFQKFTWKADGTGIWRETMTGAAGGRFDMVCASLITYDGEKKAYLETGTDSRLKFVMTRSWDAEKQSLKGRIEFSSGPVRSLESTATFSGDDRIDWRSEFSLSGKDKDKDQGKVQAATGHYERM